MRKQLLEKVVILVAILVTVSLSGRAKGAQITFSFETTCDPLVSTYPSPSLPPFNASGIASDTIRIDTLTSDVPGFTTPVTVSGGLLTFETPLLSLISCFPAGRDVHCENHADNP